MSEKFDNHNHSHDGIDNSEHILDMQKQLSMLLDNIKDNTDTSFSILKLHEEDDDQDAVDVYRINCSSILDCEKLASERVEHFNKIFDGISNEKDAIAHLNELEDIFDKVQELEKSSEHSLRTLLELLKQ